MLLRRLALLVLLVIALVVLAGAAMFANARADPVVRRADITLPGWPDDTHPVTLALVSDIHIGSPAMDAARLARIVARLNALHPDMVVIAGDFIAGHDPHAAARVAPELTAPLSRLRAPLGTIAVLGNHDHWTGATAVLAALRRAGVTVLENAAVRRGPLSVGGIGDRFTGHDRIAPTLAAMRSLGGARVVLTHGPDLVPDLPRDMRLVLAGHTHCGQGVIFGHAVGSQPYAPRYRCGLIREGGRAVVVTAGLGTSVVPLRLNAPPDVWLLTLRG
ncbi:metallophosphoesterase [Sphingomonas sp. RS2018]